MEQVDRGTELVGVAVGFVAGGAGAEEEAAEERLHCHDAGAYDARVCFDYGPEVDGDAIVGPVCVTASGGEFGESDNGDDTNTSR